MIHNLINYFWNWEKHLKPLTNLKEAASEEDSSFFFFNPLRAHNG